MNELYLNTLHVENYKNREARKLIYEIQNISRSRVSAIAIIIIYTVFFVN